VIVTIGLLYQLELAVEVGRLALHEQHLFFGQSLDRWVLFSVIAPTRLGT
jgi:hypothetical protein